MAWTRKSVTRMSLRSEKETGEIHGTNDESHIDTSADNVLDALVFTNDSAGSNVVGIASWRIPDDGIVTPEERWNMIAVAAYYRAEQRGFIGGNPAEDWIAAEKEIDSLLNGKKQ